MKLLTSDDVIVTLARRSPTEGKLGPLEFKVVVHDHRHVRELKGGNWTDCSLPGCTFGNWCDHCNEQTFPRLLSTAINSDCSTAYGLAIVIVYIGDLPEGTSIVLPDDNGGDDTIPVTVGGVPLADILNDGSDTEEESTVMSD